MTASLWKALRALAVFDPIFVSVTYGAGGKTGKRTHEIVHQILRETQIEPAAHLTCVGQTRAELKKILADYWQSGVRHIVALRGDMPDMAAYQPHQDGFASTPEFITAISQSGAFQVSVSAYPEKHPESASWQADMDLLKLKIEAGASRAITQFSFDDEAHLRFRDRARAAGIEVPIRSGIMPTTNFKGVAAMAQKCGAQVPRWMAEIYEGHDDDLDARRKIAIDIAINQCETLRRNGMEHFHFYTLNQAKVTKAVCDALCSRSVKS